MTPDYIQRGKASSYATREAELWLEVMAELHEFRRMDTPIGTVTWRCTNGLGWRLHLGDVPANRLPVPLREKLAELTPKIKEAWS